MKNIWKAMIFDLILMAAKGPDNARGREGPEVYRMQPLPPSLSRGPNVRQKIRDREEIG